MKYVFGSESKTGKWSLLYSSNITSHVKSDAISAEHKDRSMQKTYQFEHGSGLAYGHLIPSKYYW